MKTLALILAVLTLPLTSLAAETPRWEIGGASTSSLQISSDSRPNSDTRTTFSINVGGGYFFTPNWELALDVALSTGSGVTAVVPVAGVKYNFGDVPQDAFFLRAQAGVVNASSGLYDGTNFTYIVGVGKRFALSSWVSYAPQVFFNGIVLGPNYHVKNVVIQPLSFALFF